MTVFPRMEFPCPLGPVRGKRRPCDGGRAGKKILPIPKIQKIPVQIPPNTACAVTPTAAA
jgi:hypothetical protein